MKQATLIFVRTLSAIAQNDPYMLHKKNTMIEMWRHAVEDNDKKTLNNLLTEIYLVTENDYFCKEINQCRETLSC